MINFTKYAFLVLLAVEPTLVRAEWFCRDDAAQRSGDQVKVCGVGHGLTLEAARSAALTQAKTEFLELCKGSADCDGHEFTVSPLRTDCEVSKDQKHTCYRGLQYTILTSIDRKKFHEAEMDHLAEKEAALREQMAQLREIREKRKTVEALEKNIASGGAGEDIFDRSDVGIRLSRRFGVYSFAGYRGSQVTNLDLYKPSLKETSLGSHGVLGLGLFSHMGPNLSLLGQVDFHPITFSGSALRASVQMPIFLSGSFFLAPEIALNSVTEKLDSTQEFFGEEVSLRFADAGLYLGLLKPFQFEGIGLVGMFMARIGAHRSVLGLPTGAGGTLALSADVGLGAAF